MHTMPCHATPRHAHHVHTMRTRKRRHAVQVPRRRARPRPAGDLTSASSVAVAGEATDEDIRKAKELLNIEDPPVPCQH